MDNKLQQYKRLGAKTLFLLILKRSVLSWMLLLVLTGMYMGFLYVPQNYADFLLMTFRGIAIFFAIISFMAFFLGWLEYIHYGIFLSEKSIEITRGMISEEKIGIPYRLIKEVRIKRNIPDQIFGVSKIIITVLGEVQGQPVGKESKILLPSIDKKIASKIQDEILGRAGFKNIDHQKIINN